MFIRVRPYIGACPVGVSPRRWPLPRGGPGWVSGAHRLRRSAATWMLVTGATLVEIAQVLCHRR